jgi:hypothetical protein
MTLYLVNLAEAFVQNDFQYSILATTGLAVNMKSVAHVMISAKF